MRTKRRRGWVKAPPAKKRTSLANNKKALNQNEEAHSSFINQNNKEKSVSASSNDVELVDEDHSHSSSDSDESLSVEDSSSDDSALVDRRSMKSTKGHDNGKQASKLPKNQRIDDVKSSRVLRSSTKKNNESKLPQQDPRYNQKELKAALEVIKKVMKLDEAQPFNVPVDFALEKPEYRNVIDTPMDFGTICINLENSVKYMNSEDVFNDVQYIWENCCKCNKKGEYIVYLMKRVKKKFMKHWTAAGLCIEQSRKVNVGTSYEPSMTDYATRNSRHEPLTPVGLAVLGSSQISQDRLGYPPHQPLPPLAYSQGQPHQLQQSPPSTAWPQFSQFPPVSDRQFSQPLPLTNLPQFSQSQAGTVFNTAGTMVKGGGMKSNLGSRGEKKSRGGGNMCTSYQSTMDDTDLVTGRRPSTTHPPPMLASSIHPHIKQSSQAQLSTEPPLEASNSQATEDDNEIGGHNSTRSTRGLNRGINTPPDLADRKTIYIVDNSTLMCEDEDENISRNLTTILKSYYNAPWPNWKAVPNSDVKTYWSKFQEQYRWSEEQTQAIYKLWLKICSRKFSGMLNRAREAAVLKGKTKDLTQLRYHWPKWMDEFKWNYLIDNVWIKEDWKKKSEAARHNRLTEKNGDISKHATELGKPVNQFEGSERSHKRADGSFVDKSKSVSKNYNSVMSQKHGNGNTIQPEYDIATRHEVVGGANHGHLYGFGKENPKNILGTPEMGHASRSGHEAHSTQNISDIVQQVMAQVVMHLDVAVQRSVNNALINVGIQPSHQVASRGDPGVVNNNAGGEGNNARSAADGSRI